MARAMPIADHALIGNSRGAALVDRGGCIDWACLPRFDSDACFAALLGDRRHGHWTIEPQGGLRRSSHRYRHDTLIVETEFQTEDGTARLLDFMPGDERSDIVRIVEGVAGSVPMRSLCNPRFGFGARPAQLRESGEYWLAGDGDETTALSGPATLPLQASDDGLLAEFRIDAGARAGFVLSRFGNGPRQPRRDPERDLVRCAQQWHDWAAKCTYRGRHRDEVMRALITMKAMIYAPSGAILAAPTASLPEQIGGSRNWDYRYCWLRDATFALYALLGNGYVDEARQWRNWLVRVVDGHPDDIRVLYGIDGGICHREWQADWLPGYRDSRPVRFGNEAADQFQIDVRGELMDLLHVAHESGLDFVGEVWDTQLELMRDLERRWHLPDCGIWEVRGEPEHFVHSKAMAWVAFDRAIGTAERFGLDAPLDRWEEARRQIRAEIYDRGFDRRRGCFVQRYGADDMDASLLLLPLLGFIPATHPHMQRTREVIERELGVDGLLLRYRTESGIDGLPGREGAFLPCSFWMVDCLALAGHCEQAEQLFDRLLELRNAVGLLPEEWDCERGEMLGNFPQSLTVVGLINSARILADLGGWGETPPEYARPEHRAHPEAHAAHGNGANSPRGSNGGAPR
jgi:GH15 family glucan-1,4-alpha-glucosidase